MSKEQIAGQLQEANRVLNTFLGEKSNLDNILRAGEILVDSLRGGGKAISCGNGGSMCDAMHFAEELVGRFRDNRPSFPAVAISDAGYLSCAANDFGYDLAFSRYVEGMGQQGDVLLAISTSGNSKNVLNAAETAKSKGMKVIGLTGKDGGELASLCDVEIRAPKSDYADRAQEIHIKVIHCLIHYIEGQLL